MDDLSNTSNTPNSQDSGGSSSEHMRPAKVVGMVVGLVLVVVLVIVLTVVFVQKRRQQRVMGSDGDDDKEMQLHLRQDREQQQQEHEQCQNGDDGNGNVRRAGSSSSISAFAEYFPTDPEKKSILVNPFANPTTTTPNPPQKCMIPPSIQSPFQDRGLETYRNVTGTSVARGQQFAASVEMPCQEPASVIMR